MPLLCIHGGPGASSDYLIGFDTLDEPMPLFFWLPTLWGGAALIFAGGFRVRGRLRLAKVLVLVGCAAGFIPSVWTLVMPALLVTLAIRTVIVRGSALSTEAPR